MSDTTSLSGAFKQPQLFFARYIRSITVVPLCLIAIGRELLWGWSPPFADPSPVGVVTFCLARVWEFLGWLVVIVGGVLCIVRVASVV